MLGLGLGLGLEFGARARAGARAGAGAGVRVGHHLQLLLGASVKLPVDAPMVKGGGIGGFGGGWLEQLRQWMCAQWPGLSP